MCKELLYENSIPYGQKLEDFIIPFIICCIHPQALKQTGIRKTDARIKEIMNNFYKIHKQSKHDGGSPETLKIDRSAFKEAIAPNLPLIARAFRSQFIIPDFPNFNKDIEKMYKNAKSNKNGAVATYIPQLAKANAENWGISVCTIDGQRSSIGKRNIIFFVILIYLENKQLTKQYWFEL